MAQIAEFVPRSDALRVAFLSGCSAPVTEARPVAWPELAALLGRVQAGAKDGPAWMPARIDPGARTGDRVQELTALVLDVEAATVRDPDGTKRTIGPEPPPVAELAAELAVLGWKAILHTSHSHTPEHPRYRAAFALSRPVSRAELRPLGLHVAAVLGIGDAIDAKALEPARLFFLPRAPRERLAAFEHRAIEGEPLAVDTLLHDAKRAADALHAASRHRPPRRTGSVIEAFNAAHDIGTLLEHHGYAPKGRDRWLFPGSTSRMPGVRLLPESDPPRVFSSHAGDPLNNGRAHDAFDVFRILSNDGDTADAVREAARLLGMDTRPEPTDQRNPAEPDDETTTEPDAGAFALVAIHDLEHAEVPEPEYIVAPILPVGVPTLLGAHGGTGKSSLALLLAACVATGRDFMGMPVQRARVLFYSAEDGKSIIRWRLRKICRTLGIDPAELAQNLVILDATDTDPTLFREVQAFGTRMGTLTAAFATLTTWAADTEARLVIVDNASDTYDANENERARVRAFMRALSKLARQTEGALLLLAHVNRETAKAGKATEGYSGSTAWHNSARSRLFLSEDEGALLLEHQKSNLGPKAEPLRLTWQDGVLVNAEGATGKQAADAITTRADADAVLRAIEGALAAGINVPTGRTGPATTWHVLGTLPELPQPLRETRGKARFWHALTHLQRAGKICCEDYRNAERKLRSRWVLCAGSSLADAAEGAE